MRRDNRKFVTPPLHWLRAFEASARHLSFTHAAAELSLTQSAVSKQVRLLESHLDMPLFLREHRSLRLTEAGRNYLPIIIRAFQSLELGTRSFLGHTTEKNLHIKANYSFATIWLANYIHEFMDFFPNVKLTISTALWEQDFTGSIADIEIHYGKKELFVDHAFQLTHDKVFPVCSHELAERISSHKDLAKERILDLTGIRDTWDYWASQAGCDGVEYQDRHYISTFVFALNMATSGRGVTLGTSTLLQHMIKNGSLCAPINRHVEARDNYFIQQNLIDSPHPATKEFIDWIIPRVEGLNGK